MYLYSQYFFTGCVYMYLLFTQSCLTLRLRGLQHARLPCPSPSPGVCSNSCPLSQWCHPTVSSSVVPFPSSSCLQSFPASGSFPMSQLFPSGGQSTRASASASVLPMNTQDWFPLRWTGWGVEGHIKKLFSVPLLLSWITSNMMNSQRLSRFLLQ